MTRLHSSGFKPLDTTYTMTMSGTDHDHTLVPS